MRKIALIATLLLMGFRVNGQLDSNCTGIGVDHCYRPYPVILVHGFNSEPSSLGTRTLKKDMSDERISTLITGIEQGKIAATLVQQFPGFLDYERSDPQISGSRFIPWEEEGYSKTGQTFGSYFGLDHTYVEAFCYRYAWESDDHIGPFGRLKFGIKNDPANPSVGERKDDYDISGGGNTQLLRIRIIQVLNEYYGDFKWVGDPTAKIKLIAHSNGGLLASSIIKWELRDPDYWSNNGIVLKNQCIDDHKAIRNGDGEFHIDRFGNQISAGGGHVG